MELDCPRLPQPEWPVEPHKIGQSLCHWFDKKSRAAFQAIIRSLPKNPIYVEFGTFLGAGSTMLALQAREDLKVICLDDWRITANMALPFTPTNSKNAKGQLCAFLRGEGTALQHCQNNLWAYRDRVDLIQVKIHHTTIDLLASQGVQPDCVLLDDDHEKKPVLTRLFRCRYKWPEAWIVCDDYCKEWPGVLKGVAGAIDRGFYSKDEMQMVGARMVAFKRNKRNA